MPELLLELFSEEIPARMQAKAAEDLRAMITNALVEAGLSYEGAQAHAGPRRLVLSVEGLNAKAADVTEERKGPRVDAPQPAIDGFLKSTGLRLDQLTVQDDKKGKFYIATIRKAGRAAADVISEIAPETIRKFPWPKSMRWGSGTLRWVRPLQSIACTFDGEVVPFTIDGLKSGNVTRGHRFLGEQAIAVRRFEDYALALHKNHVIVDAAARAETIRTEAQNLAFAQGLELIEDEGLLREVAGLVEWPVVLMGSFDESYLTVPPEVIITTIRVNQKCFCLRDGKSGKLANKYLLVSNMVASDGGKQIVAGNNKVIAARLSDAKFFWDQDRKTSLESLLPKLDAITFHAKLGTQGERVKRIEALAGEIAKVIGADVEKAKLAARLAKADLVTGMVGEFPELQGLMGRYYALDQGIDAEVADAIRDHYKPQGPSDSIPVSKVGQSVALADKLDTLVGFWAIDEKPTGSKDPYALRRAALGIVRMVIEQSLRLRLFDLIFVHLHQVVAAGALHFYYGYFDSGQGDIDNNVEKLVHDPRFYPGWRFLAHDGLFESASESLIDVVAQLKLDNRWDRLFPEGDLNIPTFMGQIDKNLEPQRRMAIEMLLRRVIEFFNRFENDLVDGDEANTTRTKYPHLAKYLADVSSDLLAFFADRLKVYLRESGARHDLIDAVFALGNQDDLLMIVRRVEALSKFLDTDDGKNLLMGVKRAANILKIEEKKDGRSYDGPPENHRLIKGEEKALQSAITVTTGQVHAAVAREDFEGAMTSLAKLRAPVDSFFDHVTVNDKDPGFRENRLKLLNRIRTATMEVADFSRIES